MRQFRGVLLVVCVAAAGLVVSAGPANATPTPLQPPTVTKSFGDARIPLNGTTGLDINVGNPNLAAALTGVTVTDTLPAGLVALQPLSGPICGGTFAITANLISMTGLTLGPGETCGIGAFVQGTSLGTIVNTTSAVTSTNGGTGSSATATLLVVPVVPPILVKAFAQSPIAVGATTTLTFTLANPNPTTPVTRITFADPLPAGLMVAANPSVINTCGGVPSVGPFALAVAYANARLPGHGICTFSVNVTATSAGVKNNTTTIVPSSTGIGSPATGTLTVTP